MPVSWWIMTIPRSSESRMLLKRHGAPLVNDLAFVAAMRVDTAQHTSSGSTYQHRLAADGVYNPGATSIVTFLQCLDSGEVLVIPRISRRGVVWEGMKTRLL